MNLELKNNFNYGKGVGKSVVNHYLLRASQLTKKKKMLQKIAPLVLFRIVCVFIPKNLSGKSFYL